MRLVLTISLLMSLAGAAAAGPDTVRIGSFADSGLTGWSAKSLKGVTEYRIVEDAGEQVLRAVSHGTASGLVYDTDYDPLEFPILAWRWKIENIVAGGDSRIKAGDDYAARIYVVFPHWFFPKTRTLNYIWANRLPRGALQANVFTANAMMIAVESGDDKVGEWLTVQRDVVADYRRAFGEDPPRVGAIVIMTDTDNTGTRAVAWYGDILVRRR